MKTLKKYSRELVIAGFASSMFLAAFTLCYPSIKSSGYPYAWFLFICPLPAGVLMGFKRRLRQDIALSLAFVVAAMMLGFMFHFADYISTH